MPDDSTMKFRADISQLKAAMNEASRAIRVANSEFKAATAGMDDWSRSADGLRAKISQLEKVVDSQKKQLALANDELEKTVKAYGENSAEADRARIKVNNYEAAVKNSEKQLQGYEKQLDDVEKGLYDTGEEAEDSGKKARDGADGFTTMKGALSNLVASGIKAAITGLKNLASAAKEAFEEFDAGEDAVIRATGATGESADALLDSYNNVAHSVAGDFSDIGSALGEVNTRFGLTGEELESATEDFMKFASVTGTDATEAVRLVSRAMGDAGIDTSEYRDLLDQLTVAGQASGVSVDALTESIAKYGAPMRALGFDTKESIALFAQWEKVGVNTETAFSGMKKAISNWSKDGKDAREEFKKTLEEIAACPNIAEATTKAIEVFGAKAGPDLADAIQGGRFEYSAFLDLIEDSQGAFENTYTETLDGADQVKLAVQGLRADMGKFVSELLDEHGPEIEELLTQGTEKLKELVQYVIENGDTILDVIGKVGGGIAGLFLINKISKTITAVSNLGKSVKGLWKILQANPMSAVLAAGAAVVTGLIAIEEGAKDAARAQYELSEEQRAAIDATNESAEEYRRMNESRQEASNAAAAEADEIAALKDQYNGLVDENGNVIEGYEEQADLILGQLAEALGLEKDQIRELIDENGRLGESIDEVIRKREAEAMLAANEDAYLQAKQNQTQALQDMMAREAEYADAQEKSAQAQEKLNSAQERYNALRVTDPKQAENLKNAIIPALEAAAQTAQETEQLTKTAYENSQDTYYGYLSTIQNYGQLQQAALSGDSERMADALLEMQYNLQDHNTATEGQLQEQVDYWQGMYDDIEQALADGMPGVTKEQLAEIGTMVDKSERELQLFEKAAGNSGKAAMDADTRAIMDGKGNVISAAKQAAREGKAGFESVDTTSSGRFFSQGFVNGIGALVDNAFNKAKTLAQQAWAGLRKGQQEGSPSKLTYQSGVYFTQGYINGIASMEKGLVRSVQAMVGTVVKTLRSAGAGRYAAAGETAAEKFADAFASKSSYMIDKIEYQNEQKLAEFDTEIERLEKERDKKTSKINQDSTKKQNEIQAKIDKETDKNKKAKLKKELAAEKASAKKQVAAVETTYKKLIAAQEKYKDAYKDASTAMLSEFTDSIKAYGDQAQALIEETIAGVTDKYQARYDALIDKQEDLVSRMKSTGSLFDISGAGVMTINDLTEQTKRIEAYTKKLQKIKGKVSAGLFDEIAGLDMEEGTVYIDQLLGMTDKQLQAYVAAYEKKQQAAEAAGTKIYKKDLQQVTKDYKAELVTAFSGLDKQLKDLGAQAMKGFVNGLTKNTDYLDKNVKTFVKSMIGIFKKELGIKSPSRVMMGIGEYTGEGFDLGFQSVLGQVRDTARKIAAEAAAPLSGITDGIGSIRASVNAGSGTAGTVVTNNYNMSQVNNSPKALSALETYQARRRQISMLKAATGV